MEQNVTKNKKFIYISMSITSIMSSLSLSFLCYTFLHHSAENEIIAVVDGHRLLENGLVVPAIFHIWSKSKKFLNVYLEELKKLITLCKHMNIELSNTEILKKNLTF